MNGEFLKILEEKLRKEILCELGEERVSLDEKFDASSHSTYENNGMVGFSWLLGATEVAIGRRPESRARSAYGVKVRSAKTPPPPPPPRPAHVFTPAQRRAFDRLAALTELADNFSVVELKKAWRAAALRTHPDRGGTAEDFRLALQAYKTLSEI